MGAFQKYDPWKEIERETAPAAKVANPAKAETALAVLATLADTAPAFPRDKNCADADCSIVAAVEFEERAAIGEFEAGISRAWAEGFARLDPDRPPGCMTEQRWRAVIDGIGAFLDNWAAEAIAKGWEAADVFGADAARPDVTWLNAGPLWYGDGARVVEVHPNRIVFATAGGVRQTAHRRPHMRARALPWELDR